MIHYKFKVTRTFSDSFLGDYAKVREAGEVIETDNHEYASWLVNSGIVKPVEAKHFEPKKGEETFVCFDGFARVGGIETATYSLVQQFPDRITILNDEMNPKWFLKLAEFANVIVDEKREGRYSARSIILAQYNSNIWLDNFDNLDKAKVYQQIHADLAYYASREENFTRPYVGDTRIDKFLAVSKNAKDGMKSVFGIDSIVLGNVKKPKSNKKPLIGFFSRSSSEKNPEGVFEFIKAAEKYGYNANYFIASDFETWKPHLVEVVKSMKNVIYRQANERAIELLPNMDYLIQPSFAEASCEVVHEALDAGVPVIVSKIPAFEYIKDGVLGWHIDSVPTRAQIENIFEKIPKITKDVWDEKTDIKTWTKVLEGKL